jgi:hypothetical protein
VGVVLRVAQYLAKSSLWIDELALVHNIIGRSFGALLRPLDYAQVAPIGFLFVEKAATVLFGTGEYALRAFPLLCGVLTLFLFRAVAGRVLSGWAVPFAVGLLSIGIPFVYFSSQVKQYSSDVAAALLLIWAALETRRQPITVSRALALGVAGAVIVWFSQAALIVIAGIAIGQLVLSLTEGDRARLRALSVTWILWGVAGACVAIYSSTNVSPLDREYFRWFWADGFMPMPPRQLSDLTWLPGKLTWVFGAFELGLGRTHGGLHYRWSPVFALVMAWGCWALWRKQRDAALFLLVPVVVAIVLSAVSLYPFTARLIAFLVPSLLIATAAGAQDLLTRWPERLQFLTPVALAILGGAPIYAIATALPPSRVQHITPVFQHITERREATDKIYVFYGAVPAFRYYAPRFGIPFAQAQFGRCWLGEPRQYLRELDRLRGARRAWILATHTQRPGELELLTGYLDRIGRRLDEMTVPGSSGNPLEGAFGYLYDLSDPARLAATSAEAYEPVLPPITTAWGYWGCYGIINQRVD